MDDESHARLDADVPFFQKTMRKCAGNVRMQRIEREWCRGEGPGWGGVWTTRPKPKPSRLPLSSLPQTLRTRTARATPWTPPALFCTESLTRPGWNHYNKFPLRIQPSLARAILSAYSAVLLLLPTYLPDCEPTSLNASTSSTLLDFSTDSTSSRHQASIVALLSSALYRTTTNRPTHLTSRPSRPLQPQHQRRDHTNAQTNMPGSTSSSSSSSASSIAKPIAKPIKTGCLSCPCGDGECTCCFLPCTVM
ncbi:hypothetical protein IWX50DRAFT_298820 [Phyllosticta citricarpa]